MSDEYAIIFNLNSIRMLTPMARAAFIANTLERHRRELIRLVGGVTALTPAAPPETAQPMKTTAPTDAPTRTQGHSS